MSSGVSPEIEPFRRSPYQRDHMLHPAVCDKPSRNAAQFAAAHSGSPAGQRGISESARVFAPEVNALTSASREDMNAFLAFSRLPPQRYPPTHRCAVSIVPSAFLGNSYAETRMASATIEAQADT